MDSSHKFFPSWNSNKYLATEKWPKKKSCPPPNVWGGECYTAGIMCHIWQPDADPLVWDHVQIVGPLKWDMTEPVFKPLPLASPSEGCYDGLVDLL